MRKFIFFAQYARANPPWGIKRMRIRRRSDTHALRDFVRWKLEYATC